MLAGLLFCLKENDMQKIIFCLLTMLPFAAMAQGGQFTGDGYYRVQNKASERYVSVVDNKSTSISATSVDLGALYMLSDFEEQVASNPATICYFQQTSGGYNLFGQDLNLNKLSGYYLQIDERANGSYRLYGKVSAVVMYLIDYTIGGWCHPNTGGGDYSFWYLLPVTQDAGQYFGVKSELQASKDGSYWATLYAGFSYKPSDSNTKFYRVSRIIDRYAVITEITDVIPENTPVLVRCNGDSPSMNKVTLVPPAGATLSGTNLLKGNFYCNDEAAQPQHKNLTAYDPTTMRMLGTTASGRPAFVKSDISYLPANKCYLQVTGSIPDELRIVTEEEYEEIAGIETVTISDSERGGSYYNLSGNKVTSPTKGLYIHNGKKVVVR